MYVSRNDHSNKKYGKFDGLYAACKAIQGKNNGVVGQTFSSRLIAFYCDYHGKIKAGFGATEYERQAIIDFNL